MTFTDARTAMSWTPLAVADASELTALLNRIDEADHLEEPCEEPGIREWLSFPGRDLAKDGVAVRDGADLIGFALVDVGSAPDREGRVRCQLAGGVDPDHRRRGLGIALFDLSEERAAVLAAERHPGARAVFRTSGGRDPDPSVRADGRLPGGADVRPLLERRGYRRARSWLAMTRDLPGAAVAEPALDGMGVREPADTDREQTRLAHIAAFADHWGSTPIPEDRWSAWWSSHTSRRALSTIAVDADGTVLGYAIAAEDKPQALHITLVGTRPEARGRGIARAVIARTLEAATRAGYASVELEVDAESLTGAARLYEGLGFTRHCVYGTYEKPVEGQGPTRG